MLVSTVSCLDTSQLALWNILHKDLIKMKKIFCCCPQRLNQIIYFKEGQISHNCILIMFTLRLLQEGDSVTLSSYALKEAFNARKLSVPSSEMHEFFNQSF